MSGRRRFGLSVGAVSRRRSRAVIMTDGHLTHTCDIDSPYLSCNTAMSGPLPNTAVPNTAIPGGGLTVIVSQRLSLREALWNVCR